MQGAFAWCWQRKVGIISYSMISSSMSMFMTNHLVLAAMYAAMGLYADGMLEPQVSRRLWHKVSGRPGAGW